MIKFTVVGSLLITSAILVICLIKFYKKYKRDNTKTYPVMVCIALGVDLSYICTMLLQSDFAVRLSYSICSLLGGWLCYSMLIFYMEYSEYKKKYIKVVNKLCVPIMVADTIMMIINVKYEVAFKYKYVFMSTGERILSFDAKVLNDVHEFIAVAITLICLIVILNRIIRSSILFRYRYVLMFVSLSVLLILEYIYLVMDPTIDYTPYIASILVVEIYYFLFVYLSKEFMKRALSRVGQEMQEMLIVFDQTNKAIFFNKSARDCFKEIGYEDSDAERILKDWIAKNNTSDKTDIIDDDFAIKKNDKEHMFRISYHGFYDDDEKKHKKFEEPSRIYMGCSFILVDKTEESKRMKKEHYVANYDVLTGLFNINRFETNAKAEMDRNPDEQYYLIYSDIKEFKLINDLFGKTIGDELLVKMGDGIREMAEPEWIFCRIGSDHFAIFLKKSEYNEDKFVEYVKKYEKLDENSNYRVHIYLGVYEVEDKDMPVSVMCDRAGRAITSIKGTYSNFAYYDESMHNKAESEQILVSELPLAMSQRNIEMYLQPQFDGTGNIIGAEALTRWYHPQKGRLLPGNFIPLLEQSGLISKLDQYMWRLACETLKKWGEMGMADTCISVNISPVDIYYIDIYHIITSLVKEYDIEPWRLKLEITETAIATNIDNQIYLINRLREAGFSVEMDDFGSGYSSLNVLKDINVDVIKLDMAFLKTANDENRARTILKMIVDLAREINLPVIVEGVETKEQKDFLINVGCNAFQGYYFDKPMGLGEFENKYLNSFIRRLGK